MTPENAPKTPIDFHDPATGLLYNSVGAKNQDTLDRLEHQYSITRFVELRQPKSDAPVPRIPAPGLPAAFDERYLRQMHGFMFQDVYPWAGSTRADRSFQGSKDEPGKSGYYMSYAHYKQISHDLAAVSGQMRQENNLRGLDKEQFVKRAAYYMDHYNHVHTFAEGNGRTVQAVFFEVARQAGYKLNLTPEHREFNPARDQALIARTANPQTNIDRLEGLLRRNLKDWPGDEAKLARHHSQAQPLSGPTPAVARIEALRELKASSQVVNLRLNELRGTTPGDPLHSTFFVNLQRNIMGKPEAIGLLAPALHRQTDEAATAQATISNGPAHLERFRKAIDRTVRLFEGQGQQQQIVPKDLLDRLQKGRKEPDKGDEAAQQKSPQPRPRGPRM